MKPLRLASAPKSNCGVTPRTNSNSSIVSKGPFFRRIRRSHPGIIIGFRAVFAGVVIGIEPIQNGVGNRIVHARQHHEHLLPGAGFLFFHLRKRIDVQPCRFVFQAVAHAGDDAVLNTRGHNAKTAAPLVVPSS